MEVPPADAAVAVLAPVDGLLVPLDAVPDPVFSGRVLGDGFAIDPDGEVLRAPFAGEVVSLPPTRHAVTLRARNGAEVLMHIGIETVGLAGNGFVAHVREGQEVAAGDRLISFDAARIGPAVPSLMIPVVLTNGDAFGLRARAAPPAARSPRPPRPPPSRPRRPPTGPSSAAPPRSATPSASTPGRPAPSRRVPRRPARR
ncbi:PTS system, glucose subfamily, IIA subunit [Methylobacterium sp. 4-46]|nr:PTS system, glucose subfamily, IIA subunit [Methylobacterium sp. 4-46]